MYKDLFQQKKIHLHQIHVNRHHADQIVNVGRSISKLFVHVYPNILVVLLVVDPNVLSVPNVHQLKLA